MNHEPYVAVRVRVLTLPGQVSMKCSKTFVFAGLFSVLDSLPRFAMSDFSGGRAWLSSPAVSAASPLIEVSELPMATRSADSPETKRCSCTSSWSSWSSRASTVPSTVLRLLMVRPITASRSATDDVSEAVCASRLLMVPPSPCRTWMISPDSWLTSCGDSAANSGLNPLNSTVRSSAGWVRSIGMVAPGRSGSPAPAPCTSATYRCPIRLR